MILNLGLGKKRLQTNLMTKFIFHLLNTLILICSWPFIFRIFELIQFSTSKSEICFELEFS